MPGAVFLRDDAVELRPIEEEDLAFLRDTINDPAVRATLPPRGPLNLAQEQEYFENVVCGEDTANFLVTADGERVGTVGVSDVRDPTGSSELGLFLAEQHWGNGYGTAASRLATDFAIREQRRHRVAATVLDGNEASRRIWEKLGYRHEGVRREAIYADGAYRDLHVYAVLADEWLAGEEDQVADERP